MNGEPTAPWSREAEVSVLGAMLIDADAAQSALDRLDVEDFHLEGHRRIFGAFGRLNGRGRSGDVVLLSEELKSAGELEAAGGMGYLAELVDAVPSAAALDDHADRLRELRALRVLQGATEQARDWISEAGPGEAGELVAATLERLRDAKELAAETDADSTPEPRGLPQAVPAADALDGDPPSFLVDGFILKDEMGLISGDGGVYKTSVGLAVAAAVAVGEPLFDRFEVNESGPVLVVSEEDGAGVLRNRLKAIAKGHGWSADDVLRDVHLLALKGATLDDPEWRDHIAAEAERVGAILAVLDPYSRLTRAAENSTDENKENIGFMSRLNREGVTVALVHHAGKKYDGKRKIDRVRGASALNQAARWIHFLERSQLGVAVEPLKMSRAELPGRFVVAPKIEADAAEPTVWSEATFEYVTEDQAEEDEADRFILDNLRRYPGTNSTGLKELAKGTGIAAVEVSAAIRRLSDVGRIDYEDGPRNAKEWHLTDKADPAEKSSARSARYPAEPAGTLPGKVDDEAAPCPSNDREGRVGRGAGESRQGEPEEDDPSDAEDTTPSEKDGAVEVEL